MTTPSPAPVHDAEADLREARKADRERREQEAEHGQHGGKGPLGGAAHPGVKKFDKKDLIYMSIGGAGLVLTYLIFRGGGAGGAASAPTAGSSGAVTGNAGNATRAANPTPPGNPPGTVAGLAPGAPAGTGLDPGAAAGQTAVSGLSARLDTLSASMDKLGAQLRTQQQQINRIPGQHPGSRITPPTVVFGRAAARMEYIKDRATGTLYQYNPTTGTRARLLGWQWRALGSPAPVEFGRAPSPRGPVRAAPRNPVMTHPIMIRNPRLRDRLRLTG